MIGGPGPMPNLLHQYELGSVPKEMADEENETRKPEDGHDEERPEKPRKRGRRRWLLFGPRR